ALVKPSTIRDGRYSTVPCASSKQHVDQSCTGRQNRNKIQYSTVRVSYRLSLSMGWPSGDQCCLPERRSPAWGPDVAMVAVEAVSYDCEVHHHKCVPVISYFSKKNEPEIL
ncbi:unnamed protein product, partial [Sphacelaria rigidula]